MKLSILSLTLILIAALSAMGQTTEFNYQGSLKDGANAANGNYDFEFLLFDALSGGSQVGSTLTRSTVAVANGTFSVKLDFGSQFPGAGRFLEIHVRQTGGGTFTTLAPRQPVGSSPYSVRSLNATTADTATNATNAVTATTATNATQLGGVAANQYVLTSDSRLSDSRPPTAGSASYIQNGTNQQTSSNFNISGTGKADVFSAATQYNIGPDRVLSVGTLNTSLGINSGTSSIANGENSFFGNSAGRDVVSGGGNSFFGLAAGMRVTTGNSNSFFGDGAGSNTLTGVGNSIFGWSAGLGGTGASGNYNSIFGYRAGSTWTSGSSNTLLGADTYFASGISFGTAIGSRAYVAQNNSLILGAINGVNGATADTNVGIGTTAPTERLNVVGNGLFTGNITVNGQLSSPIFSATTQYNLGGQRMLSVSGPFSAGLTALASNTFLGENAGLNTTPAATINDPTGKFNTFVGSLAGVANTVGANNSFFGGAAGNANTVGSQNSFFGADAGRSNTTGDNNTFSGVFAGFRNTTQHDNTFIGFSAGFTNGLNDANNIANLNTFVGSQAGYANTSGAQNTFFGAQSGLSTTNGVNNNFSGALAGRSNTTGSNNSFFGSGAGYSTTTGNANSFYGHSAGGSNTTACCNSFFGEETGYSNSIGENNSVFGAFSAGNNTSGSNNSFFGSDTAQVNTTGDNNSFFGSNAGNTNTTGAGNTLIGSGSNLGSNNLSNATAIGANASVAQNNSLVLGSVNGVNGATSNTTVGIGTTAPGVALDIQNTSASVALRLRSTAGSSSIYLDRAAAIAANSAQIAFNSAGTADFAMGTSQGSAGNSDFSIYNYGTASNALTIQRSTGSIGIGTTDPGTPAGENSLFAIVQNTAGKWSSRVRTSGLGSGQSFGLLVDAGTNVSDIAFQTRSQSGSPILTIRGDGQTALNGYMYVFGPTSLFGTLYLQNLSGGGSQSLCTPPGGGSVGQCSSSLRYKKNLRSFQAGMDIINRLKPITFDWKSDGMRDLGLGAEDVEKVDSLLVTYNKDGQVEGVKYDRIGVVLINAVKEQQAQIEAQRELIAGQNEVNKRLQAEIDALKKLVCSKRKRTAACR